MERVKTGIPGLDKMLRGGFPKGATILVSGGPGSGKSTFALQFLVNGIIKFGENGVFISLEEFPDRIIENMSGFNWPLKKILKEKKLHITRAELYDFEKFKILIEEKVEEFKMKRLVIDPITVLSLFSERPLEIRRSFLELDKLSKKLKCTSLFTCEIPEGVEAISSFGIEEFVADGIIFLYRVPCRALNIIKMRSIAHDENIRPLTISRLGIKVNPNKHAFTPFKVK